MKRKILFVALSAMLSVVSNVSAQQLELGYKKPTKTELATNTYEVEPDAKAVMLSATDNLYYELQDGNMRILTDIRRRIKILKPEGKDYANVTITCYHSGKEQEKIKDSRLPPTTSSMARLLKQR